MTCEEFAKLSKKNPAECTSAERGAHFVHYYNCEECRGLLNEHMRFLGDLTKEEVAEICVIVEKDLSDPESCEIVALAYKSIGDFSQPSDGFCEQCPAFRIEQREGIGNGLPFYKNSGLALDFVRQAVLAALKVAGHSVYPGFDPQTGRLSDAENTDDPTPSYSPET